MRSRLVTAAVLAAAAVATGGSAAQAACVGTQQTVVVCATVNGGALPTVDPDGSSYNDCIYYGVGKPCIPVSVPVPTVTPGSGDPVTVTCSSTFMYC